jgi:uncharacterized protein
MSHTRRVEDFRIPSRGEMLAARFHIPDTIGPAPCVVLGQGWGLVKEAQMDRVAGRFADAGLGALTFDYSCFGASTGEPRQTLDIARQQQDFVSVLEWAQEDGRVDPGRMGLWGYSFGAAHAIEIAARDRRVAAVVAHAPFGDGRASSRDVRASRSLGYVLRVSALAIWDRFRKGSDERPRLLPITGDSESDAAFVGSEGAGYRSILPEPSTWRNEYAARINLLVPKYRPVLSAPKVACPLLVVIGVRDQSVPVGSARQLASLAPRGVLREYDAGHFDIFFGDLGDRVIRDEIEFLKAHLIRPDASAPN